MLDKSRWPFSAVGHSPSASRASITWPTISPAVRLRTQGWVPVWQNEQLSVQPTCEETQSAPRSSSGMKTVSASLPSSKPISPLARAVGRDLRPRHAGPRDREALGKLSAERLGERRHLLEPGGAPAIDPVPDLLGAERRQAELGERRAHLPARHPDQVTVRPRVGHDIGFEGRHAGHYSAL